MEINWTEVITTVVALVIVPMVTWGLAELGKMLAAKTAAIKDAALREAAQHAIDQATDAVRIAVAETTQTFVESLKKAGKFDEAAARDAFNQSYVRAEQILGCAGKALLADAVADVNAWLTARIEASVKGNPW